MAPATPAHHTTQEPDDRLCVAPSRGGLAINAPSPRPMSAAATAYTPRGPIVVMRTPLSNGTATARTPAAVAAMATYVAAREGPAMSSSSAIQTRSSPVASAELAAQARITAQAL